nr:MAG TPA: hypothetical protein [Caudoviricetes sp.]
MKKVGIHNESLPSTLSTSSLLQITLIILHYG